MSGGEFSFFVVAQTKGGVKASIKTSFTVIEIEKKLAFVKPVNEKPTIEGLIPEIRVTAVFFETNSTLKDSACSNCNYTSPVATDKENDKINIKISGGEGKLFLKTIVDKKKPKF